MEHRHPYTARGVLTALGKSALYVLFFLGVQLLTGAIYAAIAIAGSALRPGGFDPQSILDGADTAALLADFRAVAAAGLRGSKHSPVTGDAARKALGAADTAIQRLGAQVNPKIVLTVLAARFRA